MNCTIWAKVTTTFKGLHHWATCPAGHVHEHLRNPHRHLFHVAVWIEQAHDDRDIEYLEFKDWLDLLCTAKLSEGRSCEMMCAELHKQIAVRYARRMKIEVTEDGENGALVEFP